MTQLLIGDRMIGAAHPVLVIAEIGVNHDGSVTRALELVEHARRAGADAVKLQVFRGDRLMHSATGFAGYQSSRVCDNNPSQMLRRLELSEADLAAVVQRIRTAGMIPLATPFSPADVDTIEELCLPAIKIASPDLVNRVLLERASHAGRALLVSTGASEMDEVVTTVSWLRSLNAPFALLHCVSSYPTLQCDAHLSWIGELTELGVPVGYSDHTVEPATCAMAVCAGACVVEKHLTYDRNASGPDHSASADPEEFAECVRLVRQAELLRGDGGKRVLPCERDVRTVSRQSLVLVRDLPAGQIVRKCDVTTQRPGTGIPASMVEVTIGRRAVRSLRAGTLLQWEMLTDAA